MKGTVSVVYLYFLVVVHALRVGATADDRQSHILNNIFILLCGTTTKQRRLFFLLDRKLNIDLGPRYGGTQMSIVFDFILKQS